MFVLDPHAARSCPVKTLHAFSSERPPTSGGPTLASAADFTAEVYAAILAGTVSVRDLRPLGEEPSEVQEAACLAAMEAGVEVIIAGLLPRDGEHHRRGRADLLIRTEGAGYVPGIVKYQRALDVRRDGTSVTISGLDQLGARRFVEGWRYRWSWRWANTLHLAHLWELLAPTGHRAGVPTGLVVGTDRLLGEGLVAVWVDLTEPSLGPGPDAVGGEQPNNALDRYHQEFARRVEIADRALRGEPAPDGLLPPIVTSECGYCDWWSLCRPLLDEDDLSLRLSKSALTRGEIFGLRASGVSTVNHLAAIDLDELLSRYLPLVAHRPGAEDRLRLAHRRSQLLDSGHELDRLDEGPIPVPSAAIEIDIDVETSRHDRVYLWGFLIRDASGERYHHFSAFDELDDSAEVALAVQAMTWLRELVGDSDALVFHYSDYEVVRLSRLAAAGDPTLAWAVAFADERFVDLFQIVRRHFFGANGLGLKAVASVGAGFHWRDDEPGGLNSMLWFDNAVHAPTPRERETARHRVLQYNEDDVRATSRLRDWLRKLS